MGEGPSLWQVGGGLLAVLGLLFVALKLLQRWQRADTGGGDVRLLSVRRLGPRRELQVLRVGDEVHTIYRHESAMVLLRTESHATWSEARPAAATDAEPLHRRLLAMVAAAGGAGRPPAV